MLRLGTACTVFNEHHEVLLSYREDFKIWNLPGGRLDLGESVVSAAAREVREETGVEVEIVRPIGLYFSEGRARMNILFEARPIGGELLKETDETRDNRYFPVNQLPERLFGDFMIRDAVRGGTHVFLVKTPLLTRWQIQWGLAVRWVRNYLAGRPEPRFATFDISACVVITNQEKQVWLVQGRLPQTVLDGRLSPDKALEPVLSPLLGKVMPDWAGIAQHVTQNRIVFVFRLNVVAERSDFQPLEALSPDEQVLVQQTLANPQGVWLHISK